MNTKFAIYEDTEPTYDEVQDFVEGWVEAVYLESGDVILCNEEGALKNLPVNEKCLDYVLNNSVRNIVILGNALVIKRDARKEW